MGGIQGLVLDAGRVLGLELAHAGRGDAAGSLGIGLGLGFGGDLGG